MRGSSHWGKDGHTDQIEGPGWLECLAPDAKGVIKLTQDRAVEVALLNSREYQTALENVYLSALTLTLNLVDGRPESHVDVCGLRVQSV